MIRPRQNDRWVLRAGENADSNQHVRQQTTMKTKPKRWSELTTAELAAATREFDDPKFDPPAQKPSARQAADLRRVQRKAAKDRHRLIIVSGKKGPT